MKRAALVAALVALCAFATGCGTGDDPSEGDSGPAPTTASPQQSSDPSSKPSSEPGKPAGRARVTDTIASDLEVPWGIAFLPGTNGTAAVTERDTGRLLLVQRGQDVVPVTRVDEASPQGEAGLLGVAVSPSFQEDRRLFLYATTAHDNRVLRGRLVGTGGQVELQGLEPILTGIPNGFIHDGGRMTFGPDGYLYVSTGETGDGELAQDKHSLGGKILRITAAGKPAPGNPFVGKDGRDEIWTYGHRNVQGLAFDDDGNLWASEFGSDAWDELNLIVKGGNYGWPLAEGRGRRTGLRNPQVVWRTNEASPSGLAYAGGQLWMAGLRGERLWRVTVKDGRASEPTDFFVGRYGRLRSVAFAPDGNLWLTTSNHDGRGDPAARDDRILQVSP